MDCYRMMMRIYAWPVRRITKKPRSVVSGGLGGRLINKTEVLVLTGRPG